VAAPWAPSAARPSVASLVTKPGNSARCTCDRLIKVSPSVRAVHSLVRVQTKEY